MVLQAQSLSLFIKSLNSDEWESATLEAVNEITGYLAIKHTKNINTGTLWSKRPKKVVENDIIPKIIFPESEEISMIENLKWDLVNYLLEDAYSSLLREPFFFNGLINVYEASHMPCGWSGIWPAGKLVIY
ncbi:hypothetical protein [Enterobacter quasihormaechei]|uniref:hypothetical protein n=1 Tax=Enterobacter quasihormaechei TaxID=2529382 RepID=UPI001F17000C|nr:hypothetical protein [Enterobacter quasihormaechei]